MGGFEVGDWGGFGVDGLEEVVPEETEVVAVWFLELVIFVDDGVAFLGWIERPAVAPADVERA